MMATQLPTSKFTRSTFPSSSPVSIRSNLRRPNAGPSPSPSPNRSNGGGGIGSSTSPITSIASVTSEFESERDLAGTSLQTLEPIFPAGFQSNSYDEEEEMDEEIEEEEPRNQGRGRLTSASASASASVQASATRSLAAVSATATGASSSSSLFSASSSSGWQDAEESVLVIPRQTSNRSKSGLHSRPSQSQGQSQSQNEAESESFADYDESADADEGEEEGGNRGLHLELDMAMPGNQRGEEEEEDEDFTAISLSRVPSPAASPISIPIPNPSLSSSLQTQTHTQQSLSHTRPRIHRNSNPSQTDHSIQNRQQSYSHLHSQASSRPLSSVSFPFTQAISTQFSVQSDAAAALSFPSSSRPHIDIPIANHDLSSSRSRTTQTDSHSHSQTLMTQPDQLQQRRQTEQQQQQQQQQFAFHPARSSPKVVSTATAAMSTSISISSFAPAPAPVPAATAAASPRRLSPNRFTHLPNQQHHQPESSYNNKNTSTTTTNNNNNNYHSPAEPGVAIGLSADEDEEGEGEGDDARLVSDDEEYGLRDRRWQRRLRILSQLESAAAAAVLPPDDQADADADEEMADEDDGGEEDEEERDELGSRFQSLDEFLLHSAHSNSSSISIASGPAQLPRHVLLPASDSDALQTLTRSPAEIQAEVVATDDSQLATSPFSVEISQSMDSAIPAPAAAGASPHPFSGSAASEMAGILMDEGEEYEENDEDDGDEVDEEKKIAGAESASEKLRTRRATQRNHGQSQPMSQSQRLPHSHSYSHPLHQQQPLTQTPPATVSGPSAAVIHPASASSSRESKAEGVDASVSAGLSSLAGFASASTSAAAAAAIRVYEEEGDVDAEYEDDSVVDAEAEAAAREAGRKRREKHRPFNFRDRERTATGVSAAETPASAKPTAILAPQPHSRLTALLFNNTSPPSSSFLSSSSSSLSSSSSSASSSSPSPLPLPVPPSAAATVIAIANATSTGVTGVAGSLYSDELQYSDLVFQEKIGEGAYGVVYRGWLWGQEVAIKRIQRNNNDNIQTTVHIKDNYHHANNSEQANSTPGSIPATAVAEWIEPVSDMKRKASHEEDFYEADHEGDGDGDADADGDADGMVVTTPLLTGSAAGSSGAGVATTSASASAVSASRDWIDREFEHELRVMRSLRHPNIVVFLGACVTGTCLCLVTEYLPQGSVEDLISRTRQAGQLLRQQQILSIAYDVAKGLNWLHHRGILHRDLKSANILLDANGTAKIIDFGLAHIGPSNSADAAAKGIAGTPAYMAPEVLAGSAYNASADVYSFGILLNEMIRAEPPYHSDPVPQHLREFEDAVIHGTRPSLPHIIFQDSCAAFPYSTLPSPPAATSALLSSSTSRESESESETSSSLSAASILDSSLSLSPSPSPFPSGLVSLPSSSSSSSCCAALRDLIVWCWRPAPGDRPTVQQIMKTIARIQLNHSESQSHSNSHSHSQFRIPARFQAPAAHPAALILPNKPNSARQPMSQSQSQSQSQTPAQPQAQPQPDSQHIGLESSEPSSLMSPHPKPIDRRTPTVSPGPRTPLFPKPRLAITDTASTSTSTGISTTIGSPAQQAELALDDLPAVPLAKSDSNPNPNPNPVSHPVLSPSSPVSSSMSPTVSPSPSPPWLSPPSPLSSSYLASLPAGFRLLLEKDSAYIKSLASRLAQKEKDLAHAHGQIHQLKQRRGQQQQQ